MLLLLPIAAAAPLRFGLGVGPMIGSGESALGSWVSVGPQLTGDISARAGWLEGWAGLSVSGLAAGSDTGTVAAALLEAEVGLGFGIDGFSGGFFAGGGYPGGELGLYGRGTTVAPRWAPSWARRVGAEARLTWLGASESTAFSVLFRVEPGPERRRRRVRRGHEEPYAEGPSPVAPAGESAPAADPAPPADSTPAPAEPEPPPPEPSPAPTDEHHDEPY